MKRFAFVIHPLVAKDISRKFKVTASLPDRWVESFFSMVPPFAATRITGIQSATGVQAEGWFIGLPMTARGLLETPWEKVLPKLLRAGKVAEDLGAGIMGLGAFTKVVGDRGVSVAKGLKIPVTTGNSLTTWTAVQGTVEAARQMGIDLKLAKIAVIGATGAIGKACALLLAPQAGELILVGRDLERLEAVARDVAGRGKITISTDPREAARRSQVLIAVSSAPGVIVEAEDLQPGAVVCDVARPRNVSAAVGNLRDDVLVIDGGVIRVPGAVDFGMDFGFPPGTAEACIAETITLALEGRYESFTLGGEISPEKVEEIGHLSEKHGFKLDGFRRFERAIPDYEVAKIRANAAAKQ